MAENTANGRPHKNVAETASELAFKLGIVHQFQVENDGVKAVFASVPDGRRLEDMTPHLDTLRIAPRRLKGTAALQDAASFTAHVNRFKDEHSALFVKARGESPSLQAVLDYHKGHGDPRHCGHRAVYHFPLSEEFQAWQGCNGQEMGQADFAQFIEDRVMDIMQPPARDPKDPKLEYLYRFADKMGGDFASPQRMVELSRGLSAKVQENVVGSVVLQSGETVMSFSQEHHSDDGGKLAIPKLFMIALPVFHAGPAYRLCGRLRYRIKGPVVLWSYHLWRLTESLEHAVTEVADQVAADTGLPLFHGSPEA